jgi:pimeloyl-ACP methyl ester carboxylesterase
MELAHEITGTGPTLVAVHGITESRETWRPLLPRLAERWRVLAVDLRGHGRSPAADPYDPLTLATDVHDTVVAAGFDGDGPDAACLVGHSLGGVVVSAYAALFPSRAVVNVDQSLRLSGFKEVLGQLEPMLRGDPATFQAAIDAVFSSMAGPLPPDEVVRVSALRRADQQVVLGVWATVFASTADELDAQVDGIVGAIRTPYLALHGSDPGPDYGQWLCTAVSSATFEVWPDHGHYPHLVDPTRFVERIAAFDPAVA